MNWILESISKFRSTLPMSKVIGQKALSKTYAIEIPVAHPYVMRVSPEAEDNLKSFGLEHWIQ